MSLCPIDESISKEAHIIAAALRLLSDEELLHLADDLVALGFEPEDFSEKEEDSEDITSSQCSASSH